MWFFSWWTTWVSSNTWNVIIVFIDAVNGTNPFLAVLPRFKSCQRNKAEPLFTKKTSLNWYRESHYKPKTVVVPSNVYNGDSYIRTRALFFNEKRPGGRGPSQEKDDGCVCCNKLLVKSPYMVYAKLLLIQCASLFRFRWCELEQPRSKDACVTEFGRAGCDPRSVLLATALYAVGIMVQLRQVLHHFPVALFRISFDFHKHTHTNIIYICIYLR